VSNQKFGGQARGRSPARWPRRGADGGAQIFTYHVHTDGPFLPDGATALRITDNATHAFSAPVGDSVLC